MKIQSIILPLTKSSISISKSMLATHLKDQGIQDFDLFFFEKQVCCIYNHKKDLRDNLLLKFVKDFDLEQQAIRTFLGDRPVYRNLIHNLMKARAT